LTTAIGQAREFGMVPLFEARPLSAPTKKEGAARASEKSQVAIDAWLTRTPPAFIKPPAPNQRVSAAEASAALGRVTGVLNTGQPAGECVELSEAIKASMDSMMTATTLLVANGLGKVAMLKAKALDLMSDQQEKVRDLEVQKIREQMDAAIEQQQKAKKAGIFAAVFDWIVAAVEVVSGVAKMAVGAVTGNVMMVAGGAMDFLAGAAGVVKAVTSTLAVIDPANAEKYKAIGEKAGYIQLAFEIAGAVVDVTSAVRNAIVTKAIPKAAKAALKEGAEQSLMAAIKSGEKAVVTTAAKELGEKVASKVAGEVAQQLGKSALDASKSAVAGQLARTIGAKQLMKAFSEKAIATIVQEAAERVARNVIKEGGEITAKELTKRITKEIAHDVAQVVMKTAALSAVNVMRAATVGASKMVSGIISIERAKLQKEIQQLILDQEWLQMLFDEFAQRKKEQSEKMKELVEGEASAMKGGSDALKQFYNVQTQGIASIASVAARAA